VDFVSIIAGVSKQTTKAVRAILLANPYSAGGARDISRWRSEA